MSKELLLLEALCEKLGFEVEFEEMQVIPSGQVLKPARYILKSKQSATKYPKLTFRNSGKQIDLYVDGQLFDGQQLSLDPGDHFADFAYVFKRAFDLGRASK